MTVEKQFWVRSIYGSKTRQPIVVFTTPGGEEDQMTPAEARDLAFNLLTGAEAADQDGFIIEFFMDKMQLDKEHAAFILGEFREWREKRGMP